MKMKMKLKDITENQYHTRLKRTYNFYKELKNNKTITIEDLLAKLSNKYSKLNIKEDILVG